MGSKQQPDARFIVIEGMDGAGTTTQTRLVGEALRARDLRVCLTAEPSDGPLGRVLRAHVTGEITLDPITAALTFSADRSEHLAHVIRPALRRGETVVCDRYLLSTLAYQGSDGIDREFILAASESFEIPDLTVFLDVPPDNLAQRLSRRKASDRYEDPALTDALRASYELSIALLKERGHVIELIDGTSDQQNVLSDVLSRLDALG